MSLSSYGTQAETGALAAMISTANACGDSPAVVRQSVTMKTSNVIIRGMRMRSNENKMSDGGRDRAVLGVKMW